MHNVSDNKMMEVPFFTILTATLNMGATIRKTLESIRNQKFQSFEHIVIDGGSQDETLKILEEYKNTYAINWLSEPDDGIADALNKGLHMARGRYVLVIQADDQLLEAITLNKVHDLLNTEQFDIYCFPVILNHPVRGHVFYKPISILWWYHFKVIFPHQGCFVHNRLYNQLGGFRKEFSIAFDCDFFYRALSCKCGIKFEKDPVALMGGGGISSQKEHLSTRLYEEALVQKLNEKKFFWRLAQLIFRIFYFPYKTQLLPRLRTPFRKKHFFIF